MLITATVAGIGSENFLNCTTTSTIDPSQYETVGIAYTSQNADGTAWLYPYYTALGTTVAPTEIALVELFRNGTYTYLNGSLATWIGLVDGCCGSSPTLTPGTVIALTNFAVPDGDVNCDGSCFCGYKVKLPAVISETTTPDYKLVIYLDGITYTSGTITTWAAALAYVNTQAALLAAGTWTLDSVTGILKVVLNNCDHVGKLTAQLQIDRWCLDLTAAIAANSDANGNIMDGYTNDFTTVEVDTAAQMVTILAAIYVNGQAGVTVTLGAGDVVIYHGYGIPTSLIYTDPVTCAVTVIASWAACSS